MLCIYKFNEMQTKDIRNFTVEFRIRDTFTLKGIIANRSNNIQLYLGLLGSKIIVKLPNLFRIYSKSS